MALGFRFSAGRSQDQFLSNRVEEAQGATRGSAVLRNSLLKTCSPLEEARAERSVAYRTESRRQLSAVRGAGPQLVANTRTKTTTPFAIPDKAAAKPRDETHHRNQLSYSANAQEFRWWKGNVPER
jgi:hypothetical protein